MSEATFALSCLCCGQLYTIRETHRRKRVKCRVCGDRFLACPDQDPERKIEVVFSRRDKNEEASIDRVIRFINKATDSLDVAIYSLTHEWLKGPISDAKRRNVRIRIVTDQEQALVKGADAKYYRDDLGISLRIDTKAGKMHHKFAIKDGRTVLTGSYNWTKAAEGVNRENFVFIHESHVVRAYQREFEALWKENENQDRVTLLG